MLTDERLAELKRLRLASEETAARLAAASRVAGGWETADIRKAWAAGEAACAEWREAAAESGVKVSVFYRYLAIRELLRRKDKEGQRIVDALATLGKKLPDWVQPPGASPEGPPRAVAEGVVGAVGVGPELRNRK